MFDLRLAVTKTGRSGKEDDKDYALPKIDERVGDGGQDDALLKIIDIGKNKEQDSNRASNYLNEGNALTDADPTKLVNNR